MFVDKVTIRVEAGHGGRGSSSFRRVKYVPKGGPDGGDGGHGGSVVFRATSGERCLVDLKFKPQWQAERGGDGAGQQRHGANGQNCYIPVPLGTLVFMHDSGDFICDLCNEGDEFVIARGGRGGQGNLHYVNSVNQAPTRFQPGEEGEGKILDLELKTVADVGLVGYPNAGKSTFLSAVSAARPKTAPYPFTTLHPIVGVIDMEDYFRFTIADIPGLIQGAHENVGLGHDFLRHIERCPVFCFVLDMGGTDGRDPLDDLATLRSELEHYEEGLSRRPSLIIANKMDLPEASANLERLRQAEKAHTIIPVCAELGEHTTEVIQALRQLLDRLPPEDGESLRRILAKRRRSSVRPPSNDAKPETEWEEWA